MFFNLYVFIQIHTDFVNFIFSKWLKWLKQIFKKCTIQHAFYQFLIGYLSIKLIILIYKPTVNKHVFKRHKSTF